MTPKQRGWSAASLGLNTPACGMVLALSAAVGLQSPAAQEFRSGVTLRVLDVVVTDAEGRPARGLGPEDFAISEDGTPVSIRFVTPIETPTATPPPASAALGVVDPNVWTNLPSPYRTFAIVLDDLNTRPADAARARSVVQRFIDRLPDGDLAALVLTGQQAGAQEFTTDKARLARSLRRYTGRHPLPDLDLVSSDDASSIDRTMRSTLGREVAGNYQRALQTLLNVTDWLSGVQDRRKAILYVTAGLEPALARAFLAGLDDGAFSGVTVRGLFAQLVQRAAAANVAIYPLDYQGLSSPTRDDALSAAGLNPLIVMAEETGGAAGVNSNDPDALFARLIQDASAYYLVGFEPPAGGRPTQNARAHRLTVRMRSDGHTARARRTYVSPPSSAARARPPSAAHLLSSPLPSGDLALQVQASPFPTANGRSRVFAVIDVKGAHLARRTADPDSPVELAYRLAATDADGKVQASDTQDLTLTLSGERLQQIQRHHLRIFSRLDLPPGSFRLRASVVNAATLGVVAGDLDVPDYRKATVTVSEPLVVSSATAAVPVRRNDYAPFDGHLSAAPTAQREFGSDEALEVYLEVLSLQRNGKARLRDQAPRVKAIVLDGSRGQIAQAPTRVGPVGRGIAGGLTYPVTATLSLSALAAGQYELELQVEADDQPGVTRRVNFRVR